MKYINKLLKTLPYLAIALLVGFSAVYAVDKLTPTGTPADTMYSLTDIYNLASGTTTTLGEGAIPATPDSVAETGKTLTEVYVVISDEIEKLSASVIAGGTEVFGITGKTSVVDTDDANATENDIISPKTAYVNGVKITGVASAGYTYGDNDASKVLYNATAPGTARPAQPLKTGQIVCYDASGAVVSCSSTGQDGDTLAGVALSYTDNLDGTITDNATGLIWQKQDDGVSKNWTTALAYCNNNIAGLPGTGWRLPNIKELQSIVDFSQFGPSINPLFTSTQSNNYWSSTSYQVAGTYFNGWFVNFQIGYSYNSIKTSSHYVRCVR